MCSHYDADTRLLMMMMGSSALNQAWAKPIAGGGTAALLLSRNASAAVDATVDFKACNVSKRATVVTDLWSGEALGTHTTAWSAKVSPHAHRFIKIMPPAKEL